MLVNISFCLGITFITPVALLTRLSQGLFLGAAAVVAIAEEAPENNAHLLLGLSQHGTKAAS
jgi:hypothetical protein